MAELLADVQDVRPLRQELRSERMPQIMKPDRTKPCLFKHPLEIPGLHVLDVDETPQAVSKDPVRDFIPTLFQCLLLILFTEVPQGF